MPRSALAYVYDIHAACAEIDSYCAGKSFEEFRKEGVLQAAVERKLGVIGEALNRALQLEPTLSNTVSDAAEIVALRNLLIHAYWKIDPAILWDMVERDVPRLQKQCKAHLDAHPPA